MTKIEFLCDLWSESRKNENPMIYVSSIHLIKKARRGESTSLLEDSFTGAEVGRDTNTQLKGR